MVEYEYRIANSENAFVLSALAIAVWVETYAEHGIEDVYGSYIEDALSVTAFETVLASNDQQILCCFVDQRLVGFAAIGFGRKVPETEIEAAELSRLYIHSRFQGKGIGRHLIALSTDASHDAGFERVWLSVYAGNVKAIEFYRNIGLQHSNDIYFELGEQKHLNHVFIMDRSIPVDTVV